MIIEVHVKASSKNEKMEKVSENVYKIWVKEPAKDNKANFALVKLLSSHFKLPQSSIRIIKGQKNKIKTVAL